jgi:hypothetical protein
MPILSEDIKLLKSQVMDDTPEGGGAMTGNVVVDGQSNNLFPDTSTLDRAFGRVNIRQVYGVAHTNDTDTLLGAHTIITEAPVDPLVHCTLVAAPEWGATRDAYREAIERYLVKGAQLLCKVLDQHYKGSLLLRLYQVDGAAFPAPGEAVVLRNPDGAEQYVRILKVTVSQARLTEQLGSGAQEFVANIAICDLAQEIAFDVLGAAATQISAAPANLARVYSTTPANGAKFYAIKPLVASAFIGDATITLEGGIYTPIIPAATSETPLIDQVPHGARRSLSRTALSTVLLPGASVHVRAGAVLHTPGPMEPGSVAFAAGATSFVDDGSGVLKQGTSAVGVIDYFGGTVTLSSGAPDYGVSSVLLAYRPATLANSPQHSDSMAITLANQGRSFVYQFAPAPAPGSFALSYMAQGRWYDLFDNANGLLSGADNSYGSGTINYSTGSVAYTLGAIPDIGSDIIYSWGDAAVSASLALSALPARAYIELDLGSYAYNSNYQFTWARGATNYAATLNFSTGAWSGDATGGEPFYDHVSSHWLICIEPTVLPSGDIMVQSTAVSAVSTQFSTGGVGAYTLTAYPVQPRSVSFRAQALPSAGIILAGGVLFDAHDDGVGGLVHAASGATVGSINYTTGALVLNAAVILLIQEFQVQSYPAPSGSLLYFDRLVAKSEQTVAIQQSSLSALSYTSVVAASPVTAVLPANLRITVPTPSPRALDTGSVIFSLGGDLYSASAGTLRKGWVSSTGAAVASGAGVVSSSGVISITSPPAGGTNTVVWHGASLVATTGYVSRGVFRLPSAPIKVGNFQMSGGTSVSQGDNAGVLSGGGVSGTVDYRRGIVRWSREFVSANGLAGWFAAALPSSGGTGSGAAWRVAPSAVPGYVAPVSESGYTYNAVFLQYLPLNSTILGLDTSRLPLDGRVPAYRAGDAVIVHNTQQMQLPNPLTKGTAYNLPRNRLAHVRVRTVTGVTVDAALYAADLDNGTLTAPASSDITALAQPWTVEHRIEDMLVCSEADLNGKLKFTRSLTHNFPANTSFASSALIAGDVFGRVSNVFDQQTWTGVWADERIGSDTAAAYNTIDYPLQITNLGAVTERWALIFTNNTTFRIVGEKYGQIGLGDVNTLTAPINAAVGSPFFSAPALGWGTGWSAGNVLRFNTYACGTAIGIVRTVLQGPDSLASDNFTVAFRGDVNA